MKIRTFPYFSVLFRTHFFALFVLFRTRFCALCSGNGAKNQGVPVAHPDGISGGGGLVAG